MRFAGIDVGSMTHAVAIVDETCGVLLRPTSFGEDAAGTSASSTSWARRPIFLS